MTMVNNMEIYNYSNGIVFARYSTIVWVKIGVEIKWKVFIGQMICTWKKFKYDKDHWIRKSNYKKKSSSGHIITSKKKI